MGWHWGILASSGGKAGAYDLLETTLISTNTASVTFSSLGSYSAYKHLQVRMVARSSVTNRADIHLTFNADSTSSYAYHTLFGAGSSVASNNESATTAIQIQALATLSGSTADSFGAGILDILDFSSSNKNSTTRTLYGRALGSGFGVGLASGLYTKTDAITSLTLTAFQFNFVSGSRFSLYGVK
jgi:hypothetical protein